MASDQGLHCLQIVEPWTLSIYNLGLGGVWVEGRGGCGGGGVIQSKMGLK